MLRASRLTQEGRFAVVTNVECGMRWTALLANDERERRRTAKSCGPDTPMLVSTRDDCFAIAAGMVARKPVHQGDHEGSRKTIAQGMPVAGFTCSDLLVCFFHCTRGYGCLLAPGIPCALSFSKGIVFVQPGRVRAAGRKTLVCATAVRFSAPVRRQFLG
jgi:hypothetical protein